MLVCVGLELAAVCGGGRVGAGGRNWRVSLALTFLRQTVDLRGLGRVSSQCS